MVYGGMAALFGPKAWTDCAGTAEGGAAVVLVLLLDPRPDLAAGGFVDDALLYDAAAAASLMDDALLWDVGGLLRAALLGVDSVMTDSVMTYSVSAAVRLATEVS